MWKGIVGKSLTPKEFQEYVCSLNLFKDLNSWHPQFIVLHNTSAPTIAQWHSHPVAERLKNLESYYRDEQHWSSGPHLFVADDLISVFTPLNTPGTHSPSWNGISWGIEMVGEYETENFDSGLGGNVHANAVSAIATLSMVAELDSSSLRFHKEDPNTTHKDCPGKHVSKAGIIMEVHNEIVRRRH